MKNKSIPNIISISLLIIIGAINAIAQENPDPGVDFDLQNFIDQELAAGKTTVEVPPGRYRVAPDGITHLRFENLNGITIIADSVEMICTETVQAIQIENCTNFTIRGLTVDFDPLPFTQGRITSMSSDKRRLNVDILDGYSTNLYGNKLEIYDPVSGELSTVTYYGTTYTVDEVARTMVINKWSNSASKEEVGDIIVMDAINTIRTPHTILPVGCTNLVLENITVYSGTTFAYFERDCENSRYINCKVDRRPLETDLKVREIRRFRSNNADAFHSKHATIGPKYIGCLARYMGDDGIAINGDYHVIMQTSGNTMSVVGKKGDPPNLAVGDSVELVSYTGVRLPNAKITLIETGPPLTAGEKQFLQDQNFNAGSANTYQADNVYYLKLDREVSLPLGSLVASANKIGNGFEVTNCTMGPNRSRGILVKASNGSISGNQLVNNWGQAIKVAPEYVWLEAGSSNNVTISNNVIADCHDAAIAIYSYGGNGWVSPAGAHNNIVVTGNSITGSTNPAIAITSTSDLQIDNNTIGSSNNSLLVPWIRNSFGRNEDPARKVYLRNVEMVGEEEVTEEEVTEEEVTEEEVTEEEVVVLGTEDELDPSSIKILGNPISDELVLDFSDDLKTSYSIYDVLGRTMYSSKTSTDTTIDTSGWESGLYLLQVKGGKLIKLIKK